MANCQHCGKQEDATPTITYHIDAARMALALATDPMLLMFPPLPGVTLPPAKEVSHYRLRVWWCECGVVHARYDFTPKEDSTE